MVLQPIIKKDDAVNATNNVATVTTKNWLQGDIDNSEMEIRMDSTKTERQVDTEE